MTRQVLDAVVNGLLLGGIYSLIAMGLTVIFGVMRVINFAHGAFMMIGMYITYWLFTLFAVDPYLSILATVPALFVIGAAVQRLLIAPILDAPEHNQLLLTLGLMIVIENAAQFLWSPNYRTVQVPYAERLLALGPVSVTIPKLVTFLVAIVLALGLYLFLNRSYLGRAMTAAADEPEGAIAIGLNVRRLYLVAFGLGSACVGAAGSLMTPFFYISPTVGFVFVITAFVVVVFGGMGNVMGALVGGMIIGVAESLGAIFAPGSTKQATIYVIFLLLLLFRPTGIFGKGARTA